MKIKCECEICKTINFQTGTISRGKIYCRNCYDNYLRKKYLQQERGEIDG